MIVAARPWKPRVEYPVLRRLAPEGAEACAEALDRSVASVKHKCAELRISLRRSGSKRGLVMGQPRSVSLASDNRLTELRELVLAGKVDMSAVLERVELSTAPDVVICPSCGKRPAQPRSRFGLCAVCHKEELVVALNDQLRLIKTKKAQQKAWQDIHRAKAKLEEAAQ